MSKKNQAIKNGSKGKQINSKNGFLSYYDEWGSLLPPPSILESYEEISPGFVMRLAEIMKKEQNHRHVVEMRYLSSFVMIMCFAKVISLIAMALLLGVMIFLLLNNGDFVLSLTALVGAILCFLIFGLFLLRQTSANRTHSILNTKNADLINKKNKFAQNFIKNKKFFK